MNDPTTRSIIGEIEDLMKSQKLAALSTEGEMGPYVNIVSFTFTSDLKNVLFATTRATRKYSNLTSHNMVSLLVDNRTNTVDDLFRAKALTIIGSSRELKDKEKETALTLMKDRHPYLHDFLNSPSSATIMVHVHRYILVNNFQNVREVIFHDENDNTSI